MSTGRRWHSCISSPVDLASLLTADFCPACSLCGCNSLASCRRHCPLPPTRLISLQIDFPECCEGSGYAVQFILKSRAFLLELTNYRLHQCLWHPAILTPTFGRQGGSHISFTGDLLRGATVPASVDFRRAS